MSDILILLLTIVLINNLLVCIVFALRKPIERRINMSQMDILFKNLLIFIFLFTPFLTKMTFLFKLYRHIGAYNGDDGINIIWREAGYSLNNTTPYGYHWLFVTFFVIWILGILILGIYRQKKEKKVLTYLKNFSQKNQDPELEILVKKICEEIGLKMKVIVWNSNLVDIPFTTGILHPEIFLSSAEKDKKKLQLLLKHELVHCKNYDCLYRKILFWIDALYWFNPFFRIFTEYFIEINELACDERILHNSSSKEKFFYADLLVNIPFANAIYVKP